MFKFASLTREWVDYDIILYAYKYLTSVISDINFMCILLFEFQGGLSPLCFYDVWNGQENIDRDGSFYNEKEAEFIVFMIDILLSNGVEPQDIGVITHYKSQVYKVSSKLNTHK